MEREGEQGEKQKRKGNEREEGMTKKEQDTERW